MTPAVFVGAVVDTGCEGGLALAGGFALATDATGAVELDEAVDEAVDAVVDEGVDEGVGAAIVAVGAPAVLVFAGLTDELAAPFGPWVASGLFGAARPGSAVQANAPTDAAIITASPACLRAQNGHAVPARTCR